MAEIWGSHAEISSGPPPITYMKAMYPVAPSTNIHMWRDPLRHNPTAETFHGEISPKRLIAYELNWSMARAGSGDGDVPDREIRLSKNPDGEWTARDLEISVAAEGASREAALQNLDAVIEAIRGDGGQRPTDKEIRDLDVDPEIARSQGDELLDVLQ